MKKLKVDLELLVQSFCFDNEGLCKEYLDAFTGDIINIPVEVEKVAEGILQKDSLADWQKDLLEDAYAIAADEEHRYILIPQIEALYSHSAMEEFTNENIKDPELSTKLLDALIGKSPVRSFKNVLTCYPEELDKWYDYEEEKGIEFARQWLNEHGIHAE